MRIECSCQGLNENCYRCFGRGYYDDQEKQIALLPSSRTRRSIKKPKFKKPKFKKPASSPIAKETDQIKTSSAFIDGQNERLKQNRLNRKRLNREKSLIPRITCPECGVQVRSDKIENHVARVHQKNYAKNYLISGSKINVSNNNNKLQSDHKRHFEALSPNSDRRIITPITPKSVPIYKPPVTILRKKIVTDKISQDNRLSSTISERIMIKSPNNKRQNIKRDKIDLRKESNNSNKSDDDFMEKKINSDGSKDWFTFRDRGKYGSHPSFDSMDDESLP